MNTNISLAKRKHVADPKEHYERIGRVEGMPNVRFIIYPKGKLWYTSSAVKIHSNSKLKMMSVFFLVPRASAGSNGYMVARFT